jgi:hypothetical protein
MIAIWKENPALVLLFASLMMTLMLFGVSTWKLA